MVHKLQINKVVLKRNKIRHSQLIPIHFFLLPLLRHLGWKIGGRANFLALSIRGVPVISSAPFLQPVPLPYSKEHLALSLEAL
jgi:hypothetical protein